MSQIHWGVRISFAEGVGQTISNVTETVSQRLISASADAGSSLSASEAREIAKNDVNQMADYTHEWDINYEIWELNQWKKQETREASQRAKQITERIDNLLEGLPI